MRIIKLLLVTIFSVGLMIGLAPVKSADALAGLSFVRSDIFNHYACKTYIASSAYGPLYLVKTVSFGFENEPSDIGVYAKITRNGQLVNQTTNLGRFYGMVGTTSYASAYYNDKLWVQGSYYGPAPNNGTVYVRNLTNCQQ